MKMLNPSHLMTAQAVISVSLHFYLLILLLSTPQPRIFHTDHTDCFLIFFWAHLALCDSISHPHRVISRPSPSVHNMVLLSFSLNACSFLLSLFQMMWFLLFSQFLRHLIPSPLFAFCKVFSPLGLVLIPWYLYSQLLCFFLKGERRGERDGIWLAAPAGPLRVAAP